jgi:hypothetical protein
MKVVLDDIYVFILLLIAYCWVTLIHRIPGKIFKTDYELYWKWKQETEVFICIACLICVPLQMLY